MSFFYRTLELSSRKFITLKGITPDKASNHRRNSSARSDDKKKHDAVVGSCQQDDGANRQQRGVNKDRKPCAGPRFRVPVATGNNVQKAGHRGNGRNGGHRFFGGIDGIERNKGIHTGAAAVSFCQISLIASVFDNFRTGIDRLGRAACIRDQFQGVRPVFGLTIHESHGVIECDSNTCNQKKTYIVFIFTFCHHQAIHKNIDPCQFGQNNIKYDTEPD